MYCVLKARTTKVDAFDLRSPSYIQLGSAQFSMDIILLVMWHSTLANPDTSTVQGTVFHQPELDRITSSTYSVTVYVSLVFSPEKIVKTTQ